ncbi:MAG: BREX-3 system P-loop-containing protein BrxF, partial [Thermodesulfovibrionales bacterium]|nr:BREX-3 system P-loop-containing protein BrxF [Thermodesulfovibrionales bacterium]
RYVNLNLALSEKLKDVPIRERGYYVQDFIDDIIRDNPGDFLVLDNIEIIFSKHLQVEPLSILKNIGKYRKTIAAWQGSIKDGYLTYAEPWHEDYVRYNVDELECLYINMERSL